MEVNNHLCYVIVDSTYLGIVPEVRKTVNITLLLPYYPYYRLHPPFSH